MRYLLVALVLAAGCSAADVSYPGNRAVAVVFDPAFDHMLQSGTGPVTERDVLELGLHYWDGAGARFLPLGEAPADAPRLDVHRVPANGAQGGAYHSSGYVTINASWPDAIGETDYLFMQTSIAHELGHAMGLQHVADENAVMAAWTLPLPAIDASDLAEYRTHWQ